jgi:hypothetical protein
VECIIGRNREGYQMEEILQETMDVEGGDTSFVLHKNLYNRLMSSENAALASDVEYETIILVHMLTKIYNISKDDKAIATWMAFNDDRNTFNDVRLRISD